MPGASHAPIETELRSNLEAAKAGDVDAIDRVCDALRQVTEHHRALVPVLREVLRSGEPTLVTYGAIALGRLGIGAAAAVPQLVELAKYGEGTPRQAAVSALGRIPGRVSLECLVEQFESSGFSFNHNWVGPAIRGHGTDVTPYLSRLSAALAHFAGDERGALSIVVDEIWDAAGRVGPSALKTPALGGLVSILPEARGGQSAAEFFAPHACELADGPGLVHDDRFRFDAGMKSEIGIQIYRTSRDLPKWVVVFTADDCAYGASPTDVITHLATAVSHIYGLSPKSTAWVTRRTSGSGPHAGLQAEARLVMLRHEPKSGTFQRPNWGDRAVLEDLLAAQPRPNALCHVA